MIKVLYRLVLFLAPFMVLSILLIIVDPYDLFNVSHVFSDETKLKCINRTNESIPRGTILWKTIDYRKHPVPNIVLGDSRIAYVSDSALEFYFGGEAYNLGAAGGGLRPTIELFWMASEIVELENVIIQVNFDNYSVEGSNFNIYTSAKEVLDQPWSYFFNIKFVGDAFSVIYYSLTKNEDFINRGFRHSGDNWESTKSSLGYLYDLKTYRYPESLKTELREIAEYCEEQNVNLIFVIAPNFYEATEYIENSNVSEYYFRFKSDLNEVGKVIDLTADDIQFAKNKCNYTDHYHIKFEIADTLLQLIYPSMDMSVKNRK